MKNKTYFVCINIMKRLIEAGCTNQACEKALEAAIAAERGVDPRTKKNWMKALLLYGFIEPFRTKRVYDLHFENCPELLTNLLHEPKQKTLLG